MNQNTMPTLSSTVALTEQELKKLQGILLEMLLEVDRICKKYDIQYTLIGGTLLGAVRHGGFIPWDDDLDLSMMRGDYERFRTACQEDLDGSKYFFQDNTTDPEYRWGYARIRRKNSEFVRVGQEHLKMQTGIFLDIFVGDNIPDFYPLRALHCFYCFFLRKVLYSETGTVSEKSNLKRGVYKLLRRIPVAVVFRRLKGLQRWNKKETTYMRNLTFPPPKGRQLGFLRAWYLNNTELTFEGHRFPAISRYPEYLAFKYGNYMALPPPEKRHWHAASRFKFPDV